AVACLDGGQPHGKGQPVRTDGALRTSAGLGVLVARDQSCRTTLNRELLILIPPLYSMNPSFLNLFMKKFTRERVAPIISASVSCGIRGSTRWVWSGLPYRASSSSVRASRFSLEL